MEDSIWQKESLGVSLSRDAWPISGSSLGCLLEGEVRALVIYVTTKSPSLDISKSRFLKSVVEVMECSINHKEVHGTHTSWLSAVKTGKSIAVKASRLPELQ